MKPSAHGRHVEGESEMKWDLQQGVRGAAQRSGRRRISRTWW